MSVWGWSCHAAPEDAARGRGETRKKAGRKQNGSRSGHREEEQEEEGPQQTREEVNGAVG